MAIVEFGEWLPDLPPMENPGATVANGVYPKTAKSYGPVADIGAITSAVNARVQGAIAARDYAGGTYSFCGTASKLYKISGTTITDVSKPATTYACGSTESWKFVQFGENVIAVNIGDNTQSFVLSSSTDFDNLSATAPKARSIAVIKDFVMMGNTFDGSNGAQPSWVWWSAIDDPTNWPTPGTAAAALVQSDFNQMPEGGSVQAITGAVGGADGAVFMDSAIWRVQYEGPPTVFGFYQVDKSRGTPATNSVVNIGSNAFFLSDDGFYMFDGTNSVPIGANKVDKTFYADLDQAYFYRVVGAADPINKLVIWAYPGSGHIGGNPNRLIMYNWALGRWSYSDGITCETIYKDLTSGTTLEGLDALGYTLDTLPISLDSRSWTGGRLVLSAFDTSHRLCRFAGSNLAATLETGEFNGSGTRAFVNGFRPIVDGGTITGSIKYRDLPTASLTETTDNSVDADGAIHHRISARYARAQVNIAAGGTWTHAQGIEPLIAKEGQR